MAQKKKTKAADKFSSRGRKSDTGHWALSR